MEKTIFEFNKTKILFNAMFLGFMIALASYFSFLIFGQNEKIGDTFFAVFSLVFFAISDFILFPSQKITINIFNFLIYSVLLQVTYFPASLLYALYIESGKPVLFSEISITFCVLSNYLLTKYISNQLFATKTYDKKEKVIDKNVPDIKSSKFNLENGIAIKNFDDLFINSGDLATIIEKNALLQHFDSKNTFNIISASQKNQFETVVKNLLYDNYDYAIILDNSGNLIFEAASGAKQYQKTIFWISLFRYILKILDIPNQEEVKAIKFNISDYFYEISKYGNYLLIKGKKQTFSTPNKKHIRKNIDNIIFELFKNVCDESLQKIEVETVNDLILLV
ncbi:MAG: hypothetical protein WC197_05900 [Candidatus Gastranaerophilaceae bacterium]|jgi:hypothetical protein